MSLFSFSFLILYFILITDWRWELRNLSTKGWLLSCCQNYWFTEEISDTFFQSWWLWEKPRWIDSMSLANRSLLCRGLSFSAACQKEWTWWLEERFIFDSLSDRPLFGLEVIRLVLLLDLLHLETPHPCGSPNKSRTVKGSSASCLPILFLFRKLAGII